MQIIFLLIKKSKPMDSPSCTLGGEFTQSGEYIYKKQTNT